MQDRPLPILILAQSGRLIAQLAHLAGYRVWLTDYFGDQDSLAIAERWQPLPVIASLSQQDLLAILRQLSQSQPCLLVYGSGIEHCYPILAKLPDNIQLVGNNSTCFAAAKTPQLFFNLLSQLDLPYPQTTLTKPLTNHEFWLAKSACGFGGQHIRYLSNTDYPSDYYYQRYIQGVSGSALFLANGHQAQLLLISRQDNDCAADNPFRFNRIYSPWLISSQQQQQLITAINKLTAALSLSGMNSIDFIINAADQSLLLLEINPRFTAAAANIQAQNQLFQHHLNACNGVLTKPLPTQQHPVSLFAYLYANKPYQITAELNWPQVSHDIPAVATTIKPGQPICSIQLQADTIEQLDQQYNRITQAILTQLS